MDATITNAFSNALLAVFLLYYALRSGMRFFQGDKRYTLFIVLFFIVVFLITVLAAWAHYAHAATYVDKVWLAIAFGIIFLNYCVISAIAMPDAIRALVMLLALVLIGFFQQTGQFIFIALSLVFIYSLAAYYSARGVRLGFVAVVGANLAWIGMREGTQLILGYELPIAWRYDNDIYHVLLIFATYMIYRSIGRGDWTYPGPGV